MKKHRITAPLTTSTLIDAVAAELGISRPQAHETVMVVFGIIARATAAGHKVAVTNFGTWLPHKAKRRRTRNPHTGDLMWVPAQQVLRFKVSPALADAVRRRDRHASIRKNPSRSTAAAPAASTSAE